MDKLTVGVVTGEWAPELGLEAAARRRLDLNVLSVALEDRPSESLVGLIVDAPAAARARILADLARHWHIPILLETPFAATSEEAVALRERLGDVTLFSANPLRYSLPTRRLLEEIARDGDPLESLFAAWRFQPGRDWDHAMPQLLDYVAALCGSKPTRLSAMHRREPAVLLAMLRYEDGAVASLEMGAHLPKGFATETELVLECFSRRNVYHCMPENHAITVQGSRCRRHGWLPDPADEMVAAFVERLRGGEAGRGAQDDVSVLALGDEIRNSAALRG